MTADRTAATAEEFAARVAPFDAAPAAEESAVERVARAIYESDNPDVSVWDDETSGLREEYRANARAAIDAMRPAPDAPRADEERRAVARIAEYDAAERIVYAGLQRTFTPDAAS
jgi:hypothetical protein